MSQIVYHEIEHDRFDQHYQIEHDRFESIKSTMLDLKRSIIKLSMIDLN
jgi:hypothetical protein